MASGMFFDEGGHDVTMDVLSEAVEQMDLTEDGNCPKCGSANTYRAGSAYSQTDVTWPHCEDCDWEGAP